MSEASTKPYLIRAIHEWCSDNGFTPYLAVAVDQTTQVPREYVRAGEIVLNVSLEATNKLQLGNEYVEFQARFGGQARDIIIPIANVSAIYARENGHGMSFEVAKPLGIVEDGADDAETSSDGRSARRDRGVGAADAAQGTASKGVPALASVKPSSAPNKSVQSASGEAKRPNARKLKSVGTGDRSEQSAERHSDHDSNRVVSMAPESTSESGQSKVDTRSADAVAVTERQERTRTAGAPRPVAEPQSKPSATIEPPIAPIASETGVNTEVAQTSQETQAEVGTDPIPDPTKPTGGKPKLTRVK
jgi:stringent starvation protein B